jgi:hypothetical protein
MPLAAFDVLICDFAANCSKSIVDIARLGLPSNKRMQQAVASTLRNVR